MNQSPPPQIAAEVSAASGMGGSSLCPEVFSITFGHVERQRGGLRVHLQADLRPALAKLGNAIKEALN